MGWKDFIDGTEEIEHLFSYVGVTKKVKILGTTNKRVFCYKKSHNDFKFVTSHKAMSQIEAGRFKLPIWLWIFLIFSITLPINQYIGNPSLFNLIFLILPLTMFVVSIIYRKFDYLIISVGCERFSVISIRSSVFESIQKFIDEIHSEPSTLKSNKEDFHQNNYIGKWFQRFITLMTFLYSPIPIYIDLFVSPFIPFM